MKRISLWKSEMTLTAKTPIVKRVPPADLEESEKYIAGVQQISSNLMPQQAAPRIVWQYTTGEGLIGIISSSEIWSTHIACLNDSTEMAYATSLVHNAILQHQLPPSLSRAERQLIEALDKYWSRDKQASDDWFVTCFSVQSDDLNQWRAYAGGEGGYSIGFRTSGIKRLDGHRYPLLPVIYDIQRHAELSQAVAKATLKFFLDGMKTRQGFAPQQWAYAFLPSWTSAVSHLFPLLKNPAFRAEEEWRIAYRRHKDEVVQSKFRQRQLMLSRHLPIRFNSAKGLKLPIAEIKVGPSRHAAVSRSGVRDLLRAHGYPDWIPISTSKVPLQFT